MGHVIWKNIQKLVNLPSLTVIGINVKVWYTFKNHSNKRAWYGLEELPLSLHSTYHCLMFWDTRQWASKHNKSLAHKDKPLVQNKARKKYTYKLKGYGIWNHSPSGVLPLPKNTLITKDCNHMKAKTKDLRPFPRWRLFCKEMVQDPSDMDSSCYSSY